MCQHGHGYNEGGQYINAKKDQGAIEKCRHFSSGKCTHKKAVDSICYLGCPLHDYRLPSGYEKDETLLKSQEE